MELKKSRNGQRLRDYMGDKTNDAAEQLAMCMIISNAMAYQKLMKFVDEQHPSDESQAAYFVDTVSRLVVLTDDEIERFARQNANSRGYVRMCKLAHAIRAIINSEEE